MRPRAIWLSAAALVSILALGAAWAVRPLQTGNPAAPPFAGDGTTDDTAALQKAIDAGKGGVHLPKGVYRITRTLTVDLDKVGYTAITAEGTATLKMDGPGPAIRFVGTHEGT